MSTCPECNSTIKPNYTGACVTCLRRENEIVDKLPKTADGVPVVAGEDTVWWWRAGKPGLLVEYAVEIAQPYSEAQYDWVDVKDVKYCYSTKERASLAAEAAKGERE